MFDTKSNSFLYFKMANDFMKGSNERLSEISKRLEESHLSYLQTEDTPLKLDQRQKLEGFIKEYLCLVQNELKYTFPSTADIFHRSAATVQNFSGYRACTAWSAISLYAANLLAQPWRKEYRTLRTYSGYYKHEVEANLIGAEVMFELMGYKHTGLGVLTLEGPIDPDRVSFVSRDAIVASVECQILKEIWEGVSKNFTISWLEVLEFRENYVGTPEQAIRALNYRFHEKVRHTQSKPDPYLSYPYLSSAPADIISPSIQYPLSVGNYNTSISCAPEYSYLGDGLSIGNYRLTYPENFGNQCNTYGYKTTKHFGIPYHTTLPTCTSRVPTGCLIELDPPNHEKSKMNQKNCLDEVDFCQRQTGNEQFGKFEKKSNTPSSNAENWDYVYDGLRSTGYSKDLGDRDDILHRRENARISKYKTLKPSELEEKFLKYDKRKMTRSQNELESTTNTRSNNHQEHISHKKKSSFDAADLRSYPEFPLEKLHEKSRKNYQTMPNLNIFQAKETGEQISQYMKDLKINTQEIKKEDKRWICSTCTFLNSDENSICEMCLKSRHKGNEDVPLASGGKECPLCTLVNDKDVLKCTACNEDLKNSPTYI